MNSKNYTELSPGHLEAIKTRLNSRHPGDVLIDLAHELKSFDRIVQATGNLLIDNHPDFTSWKVTTINLDVSKPEAKALCLEVIDIFDVPALVTRKQIRKMLFEENGLLREALKTYTPELLKIVDGGGHITSVNGSLGGNLWEIDYKFKETKPLIPEAYNETLQKQLTCLIQIKEALTELTGTDDMSKILDAIAKQTRGVNEG